jgi:ribosome maturation factor RimP
VVRVRGERLNKIENLVAPLVASAGLELFDVEMIAKPAGVRVTVDSPAGSPRGVDFELLAELSRRISEALDNSPAAPRDHYELEVSTPGVERPLRRPEHFARAVGDVVRVRTLPGTPGDRRVEGRLAAADESGITVEACAATDPTQQSGERHIRYEEIERARTVFDWRQALAGKPSGEQRQRHTRASGERAATR